MSLYVALVLLDMPIKHWTAVIGCIGPRSRLCTVPSFETVNCAERFCHTKRPKCNRSLPNRSGNGRFRKVKPSIFFLGRSDIHGLLPASPSFAQA